MKKEVRDRNSFMRKAVLFCGMLLLCFAGGRRIYGADNITIVLDPGHGGSGDSDKSELGAVYHDVYEKDINLKIALALREELAAYGNLTVYLTRDTDQAMTLEERLLYAKSVNADLFISLHANASVEHQAYGAEVWVSAFAKYHAMGYGLGECLMKQFREHGLADRGIKTKIGKAGSDYYGIIRHGVDQDIPAVIVEHAFMDSKDFDFLDSEEKLLALAKLDAAGIGEFYGIRKGVRSQRVEPLMGKIKDQPVVQDKTAPLDVSLTLKHYDEDTGVAEVLLKAREPESKLMYYTYSTDQENWEDYILWPEGETEVLTQISLGQDFQGSLYMQVHNNYDNHTTSEPLVFEKEEEPGQEIVKLPQEEKKKVYTDEDMVHFLIPGQEKEEQKEEALEQQLRGFSDYPVLIQVMAAAAALVLAGSCSILLIIITRHTVRTRRKRRRRKLR